MTVLHIFLCGGFSVRLGEQAPIRFPTRKAELLFAYLVLNQRPFSRSELAYLLWQDSDGEQASTNLRKTLFDMRKVVGDWLVATRQTIAFNTEQPYWCDVEQITRQYKSVEAHLGKDDLLSASQAAVSEQTADLYKGDLLFGIDVGGVEDLEQWLTNEREHIGLIVKNSLYLLATYHLRMGRYTAGLVRAQRLVALDPYNEQAHRLLMRLFVRSGQINGALTQFERCQTILAEELGADPAEETAALYRRVQAAQKRSLTPLPAYSNRFFGRELDLARIDHWLDDPLCRLITIVGLGGSGKTRLAVQTAVRRRDEFLHGIVFVPLAAVDTIDGILRSILNSLNVISQGDQSIREQLFNYLHEKELVLVLDNFEQLVDIAAVLVQDLLAHSPYLKLVITSRENLQIQAEHVYRLRGLDHTEVADVRDTHSFRFFQACVERQYPHFEWVAEDEQAAVRICQLVEGLPLGIELATAAMNYHGLPEIANEIQRDFDFLITRRRDVPERHRSMRAMFAYSWRLLDQAEQHCLQKLTVFREGFSAPAARYVAQASRFLLNSLIDKSLIRLDSDGRYSIHELLRQFAAETLIDDEEAKRAHAHYFGGLLAERLPQMRSEKQVETLNQLMADLENVRTAWLWLAVHQEGEIVSRAMDGLAELCRRRNLYQEGYTLFAEATETWHKWEGDTLLHGRLCLRQAFFLQLLAQNDSAQVKFLRGEALLGENVDQNDQALIYHLQAEYDRSQANMPQARLSLEAGLKLEPEPHALCRRAELQLALCRILISQSDYATAERVVDEVYHFLEQEGDLGQWVQARIARATLSQHKDREDQSLLLLQETLPLLQELGDRFGLAYTHATLANSLADKNELEQSLAHYQTAVEIYHDLGMDLYELEALGNLGTIYHSLGEYGRASTLYKQSLVVSHRLGDRLASVYTLANLGELAYDCERWDEAEQYLQQGVQLAVELNLPARISYLLFWLGLLKSEGYTESEPLGISWFAANYEEMPQFDRNFLLETFAQKEIESGVLAAAKAFGETIDLETAVSRLASATA